MRLSTFLLGASGLVVLGVLGFRILDLEQRVDLLASQLSKVSPSEAAVPSAAAKPTAAVLTRSSDLEKRLAVLEQQVSTLASAEQTLPRLMGDVGGDALRREEAILSVVERENSRIRDVQLEWHKARWLETRKEQLTLFAAQLKLEPRQVADLYRALEDELDGLADVMRRPNFAEEPDQVASDWEKILSSTDKRAQATLTPEQYRWWQQGRLFERKVLWPWLPQGEQTAQN